MAGRWTERWTEARALEWILRLGVAGCFVGHGAFGVIGKEAWLPYFAVVGIPESWAWVLMPLVGTMDILLGLAVLVSPRPALLAYAAGWALWTALLRPLAGESVFETLERAGNYGIPLAFLVAAGFRLRGARARDWLSRVRVEGLDDATRARVGVVLRATACLLLVGHGGLAVSGKPLLAEHAAAVGIPAGWLAAVGWGEILLGLAVAAVPVVPVLVAALAWKVGTEALYPVTGAPFWEFVERAGSYAAPLALLALSPAFAGHRVRGPRLAGKGAATAAVLLLALGLTAATAGTAGATSAASAPPLPTEPGAIPLDATAGDEVLDRLRRGEMVLACRHAITDRRRGDARRVDYDDPTTQRVLSDEGRAQARRLGEVLRRLRVPVGRVLSSPYHRTVESAELAFGATEATEILSYGNRPEQREGRRELLTRPTTGEGGNRVLMTHQGVLYGNLDVRRGSIREGDCVVVAPGADRPVVVGRFGPDELAALGGEPEGLHNSLTFRPSARR